MTFREMIVKWYGAKRGAQSALARALNVEVASVSHWTSGRYKPNDDRIKVLATQLGYTEQEIRSALPKSSRPAHVPSSTLKAISSIASLVIRHPAGANPDINDAMTTILELCKGERS